MNRSNWLLLALNAFMVFGAFVGFASNEEEVLMVGALLAMLVGVANVASLILNRRKEQAPKAKRSVGDEMDARTILDLDARLEAVERAQADAADAAMWRALVESGQVTGPAADLEDATGMTSPLLSRNGQ